jgi:transposase
MSFAPRAAVAVPLSAMLGGFREIGYEDGRNRNIVYRFAAAISSNCRSWQESWFNSRRTSSWQPPPRPLLRCGKPHTSSRSSVPRFRMRYAWVWSRATRNLGARGAVPHCAQVKVQRNKTHNNDTLPLGGSHVHVEIAASFSVRLLLTHRRTLKRKFLDLENDIHHSLKVFRVELSVITRADPEARLRKLIGADALLAALTGWSGRRGQKYTARANHGPDELRRRFNAVRRAGPAGALTLKTAVDNPTRFKCSRDVGAHAGLTPECTQSGKASTITAHLAPGRWRAEDRSMRPRTGAIEGLVHVEGRGNEAPTPPRAQGALVAAARKLALILHAMSRDGSEFRFGQAPDHRRHSGRLSE